MSSHCSWSGSYVQFRLTSLARSSPWSAPKTRRVAMIKQPPPNGKAAPGVLQAKTTLPASSQVFLRSSDICWVWFVPFESVRLKTFSHNRNLYNICMVLHLTTGEAERDVFVVLLRSRSPVCFVWFFFSAPSPSASIHTLTPFSNYCQRTKPIIAGVRSNQQTLLSGMYDTVYSAMQLWTNVQSLLVSWNISFQCHTSVYSLHNTFCLVSRQSTTICINLVKYKQVPS